MRYVFQSTNSRNDFLTIKLLQLQQFENEKNHWKMFIFMCDDGNRLYGTMISKIAFSFPCEHPLYISFWCFVVNTRSHLIVSAGIIRITSRLLFLIQRSDWWYLFQEHNCCFSELIFYLFSFPCISTMCSSKILACVCLFFFVYSEMNFAANTIVLV